MKVNGHELMLNAYKNHFRKVIMTAETTKLPGGHEFDAWSGLMVVWSKPTSDR